MQGDKCEQVKHLLFLPLHGTIIGNAYGVGVSRALRADLIQYYSVGISLLTEINPQWFPHSAASGSHLPVTPPTCELYRYNPGEMAFGYPDK